MLWFNTEAWQQICTVIEEVSSHMLTEDNISVIYITFHNFNIKLNSLCVLNKCFCQPHIGQPENVDGLTISCYNMLP